MMVGFWPLSLFFYTRTQTARIPVRHSPHTRAAQQPRSLHMRRWRRLLLLLLLLLPRRLGRRPLKHPLQCPAKVVIYGLIIPARLPQGACGAGGQVGGGIGGVAGVPGCEWIDEVRERVVRERGGVDEKGRNVVFSSVLSLPLALLRTVVLDLLKLVLLRLRGGGGHGLRHGGRVFLKRDGPIRLEILDGRERGGAPGGLRVGAWACGVPEKEREVWTSHRAAHTQTGAHTQRVDGKRKMENKHESSHIRKRRRARILAPF